MEISTKIFWCRDVHVFFCKKVPSRPFLFCLVTTWFRIWHIGAWRGMCRGLHWKLITHTFVPTLAWINIHPLNYLCTWLCWLACLPRKKIVILGFAQITPTPTLHAIWATFSTFFVPRRGWMRSNNMQRLRTWLIYFVLFAGEECNISLVLDFQKCKILHSSIYFVYDLLTE